MTGSISLPSLNAVIIWLIVITALSFGVGWVITLIDGEHHGGTSYEKHIPLQISADDIEQSTLLLVMESGTLSLSPGTPGTLISGDIVTTQNRNVPVQTHEIKNKTSVFSMTQQKPGLGNIFGADDQWNIAMDPSIPASLDVRSGAGDISIHPGSLPLTFLNIRSGAGDITVDLSRCKVRHLPITVAAGLGDTTILLPGNATIAADTELGLGNALVSGLEGGEGKYYYGSPSPEDPVFSLSVKAGIGDLIVRRVI